MLKLKVETPRGWVDQVMESPADLVTDHIHCEQKAVLSALSLMNAWPDHTELVAAMADLAEEEASHIRMVIDFARERGYAYRKAGSDRYASRLHPLIRKGTTFKLLDQLLISAIIEARSCERFDLIVRFSHDAGFRNFYRTLFESEARHYALFVNLALTYYNREVVFARLDELLNAEADIIGSLPPEPCMH
ncbi:MAG: tRNA-(ms[2]io[6]A)-hydroxylase [Bacteroidetes bacterium]|nr:tRNA-(ms[2]io[6]A)-hydroxylase [Bacteroidota bacterium]